MAHILIKTSGIRTNYSLTGKKVDGVRKMQFLEKSGRSSSCFTLFKSNRYGNKLES